MNRRPDFGRPTRYEACIITQASLVVAFIFWAIGLYSACAGHGTASVIENCLESALDLASTAVVLWRLQAHDSLAHTARNAVLEARVSVFLGFTMIVLGALFISFASIALADHDKSTADDVTVEAALAVPSAILYLVVGMLQLNMAWVLNLRSLMQDATISILGAVVAVGTLISALINLILSAAPLPATSSRGAPCHAPRFPPSLAVSLSLPPRRLVPRRHISLRPLPGTTRVARRGHHRSHPARFATRASRYTHATRTLHAYARAPRNPAHAADAHTNLSYTSCAARRPHRTDRAVLASHRWVDDPNGYDTLIESIPGSPDGMDVTPGEAAAVMGPEMNIDHRLEAGASRNISSADGSPALVNRTIAYTAARVQYHFQYWWLDSAVTSITACFLIFFGVYFLTEDTRDGSRWWTGAFWFAPLPPRPEKSSSEKTPLKAP
jgi:hypothetical protein